VDEDEGQLRGACRAPGALEVCYGCAEVYYSRCARLEARGPQEGVCRPSRKAVLLGKHGLDPAVATGWDGGGGTTAASGGGGGATAPPSVSAEGEKSEDANPVHPCLIYLEEEEDAVVDGVIAAMCSACGQMICGKCLPELMASAHGEECPSPKAHGVTTMEDPSVGVWEQCNLPVGQFETPVCPRTTGRLKAML
jgi:hypothetical protein